MPTGLGSRPTFSCSHLESFRYISPTSRRAHPNDTERSRHFTSMSPWIKSFELDEVSIADLQDQMRSGKRSARSIAESYRARIEEIDRRGPALSSVIELNPDDLAIPDALDKERKERGARGPLHGIPILIKDNIDTADQMMTTAGSLALEGSRPVSDSFVVRKLREAGAVILGKTNLSEWANFRSSHSTSGWSGRGGLTRNPYALDRNACGSSAGSAAAVSANLCAATIGTETDGSIVSPASINGIVGIKPTVGLVSRSGIIPISHSQDTAGPMCRSVRDAAMMLGVMAGPDPSDPASSAASGRFESDYLRYLDPDGLRGARLGVARRFFAESAPLNAFLDGWVEALKRAGAIVIDPADLPMHGAAAAA